MHASAATRRALLLGAILCAAVSVQLGWAASTRSTALRVPGAVAYMAAWVLALAAVRLLHLRAGTRRAGDGFAALVAGGLAGIGAWIAVGPGARLCAGGWSGRALAPVAGLECRAPFGLGALLAAGMAVHAARRWLAARSGGARRAA